MTTATGVANTVMWWLQPYIIGVIGARLTLCVAMASTVVRCWLYRIAKHPYHVVAIQLLHGVSWVCIWSGGTTFAHEMAPAHLKSTAQGILSSVYAGAGASAGLLLGGWLYGEYGALRMFQLQAIGIGVTGVLYFSIEALPHAITQARAEARKAAEVEGHRGGGGVREPLVGGGRQIN
eukprot:COSAG05_NODE_6370_length_971_cov_5.089450_2_plen_178_part_00